MTILENREGTSFPYLTFSKESATAPPYDRGAASRARQEITSSKGQLPNMLDYQSTSVEDQNQTQPSMMTGAYHNPQHHQQQLSVTSVTSQPVTAEPVYFYPDAHTTSTSSAATSGRHPFTSPLMALHGMTDMKGDNGSTSTNLTGYNPPTASYYNSMTNSMLNATPHGISDILGRSELHAQLQARLGPGMYYNSRSQVGMGSDGLNSTSKEMSGTRSTLYHWPNTSPTLQSSQASTWHNKHGEC